MAKLSLNEKFAKAASQLHALKRIGPDMPKWQWDDTRELCWRVLRNEVFPELGIKEPSTDEEKQDMALARKAFNEAFNDGYTLESSNLGKHLADHGFAPTPGKAASEAKKEYN